MTTRTARACPSGGDATARRVVVKIPMVPAPALSPNMRSRRGGHHEREAATRELREAAWAATINWYEDNCLTLAGIEDSRVHVHEHIVWPKSKGVLPDPDALATYCKPIVDGIVDAGLIAGDSHKHIASVTTSQEKGTDPLGWTIITIEEAA